ncbi:MAG: hypothetical protein QXT77_03940 [Candidatus Methanomethylicaceae archaeon]
MGVGVGVGVGGGVMTTMGLVGGRGAEYPIMPPRIILTTQQNIRKLQRRRPGELWSWLFPSVAEGSAPNREDKSSIVPHSGYSDDSVISYHLLPLCQVCRRKVLFGCVSGRGLLRKGCDQKGQSGEGVPRSRGGEVQTLTPGAGHPERPIPIRLCPSRQK